MVEGKGGLNVKDYPFAFSIAALLFPRILNDSNNAIPAILGITLVGGMLGSILTIINPVGLLIREIYWKTKFIQVYPKLHSQNSLVKQILNKNFRAALSSPSISYENDKMVGMIYFLIILALAIIRSANGDFATTLKLNDFELWGIRIGAGIGFFGVFMVLIYNIRGYAFKKSKKSVSHLDRIKSVTILNLASDFSNLSNELIRWNNTIGQNQQTSIQMCKEFAKLQNMNISSFEDFSKNAIFGRSQQIFQQNNMSWNHNYHPQQIFATIKAIKEISFRYEITSSQVLPWFWNSQSISTNEFDTPISQLQSSIDSRDWYNATLKTYRITDRIEALLTNKNMEEQILPNT